MSFKPTRRARTYFALVALASITFTAPAAEEKVKPASEAAPWKEWLADPPSYSGNYHDLKERLASIPESEKIDAAWDIFDTWDGKFVPETPGLIAALGFSLEELIPRWAEKHIDRVLQRVEELDGFGDSTWRSVLVRSMAHRSPLEAARFMSERLNPMSKSYYYYVLIQGLVPSLKSLPVSEIMPVLAAVASGEQGIDNFFWFDATRFLMSEDYAWKSPDLEADYRFLLAQPPGRLRDMLLGMVLQRKFAEDMPTAMKIDLASLNADINCLHEGLSLALPSNSSLAIRHLPDADPMLMEIWISILVQGGSEPNWSAQAPQVLALIPEARRDAALSLFTRLWLKYDDKSARPWITALPDESAKKIAAQELLIADLPREAAKTLTAAFDSARALTDHDIRQRALAAVFKAAIHETDVTKMESLAKTASSSPKDVELLLDQWTLGRIESVGRAERNKEVFPLVLTLRNPVLRAQQCYEYRYFGMYTGFDFMRQVIENSKVAPDEKRALLQSNAIEEVDHLLYGNLPGLKIEGGLKPALAAAERIEDPRLRFIHQRAAVHAATLSDPEKARHVIETSSIEPAERARFKKEWERLSKWYRYVPDKK